MTTPVFWRSRRPPPALLDCVPTAIDPESTELKRSCENLFISVATSFVARAFCVVRAWIRRPSLVQPMW